MERVIAALIIVGFFSALPLWGLSSQQGWITVTGTRTGPVGPFQTQIVRRDAFSTSIDTREVIGARAEYIAAGSSQRRTAGTVRIVLETPLGKHEVNRSIVGNTQAIASTLVPVEAWATLINTARDSGQTRFTVEIAPELSFWIMLGLVVIFAMAGLIIALAGGQSNAEKAE